MREQQKEEEKKKEEKLEENHFCKLAWVQEQSVHSVLMAGISGEQIPHHRNYRGCHMEQDIQFRSDSSPALSHPQHFSGPITGRRSSVVTALVQHLVL